MNTKALRQKILDLAIHGKLVPQDPNDEPASVLLERIKAEKERLIKEGKIKRTKRSKAACDKPHYPYELPKGWCWTTIEDVCSKIGSGSTPKGSNYSKEGIPFFRSQNVQNFGIVLSDIKYISEEVHQSMKGTEVIANDLLLNITGGSLGRCAVVPINFKIGNVSQHVCILRTVLVKPEYLHCFILSSFFAKSMKITGSGREGLPKYNLEKMLFPLPPIHEQERIIIEVKQLLNCIDKLDTCRGNLIELVSQAKSKVLDLAIHGKLVQQDPSDEPASELLKRINPNAEITCDTPQYENLPSHWVLTNLKSVFDINPKNKADDMIESGFVSMSNINEGFSNKFAFEVKRWGKIKSGFTHFSNGDIAVAKISPCLENRKSMVLKELPNGIGAGTTELHVFRPLCVDAQYGLYFFKSNKFIKQCVGTFNGVVGQQRVGKGVIEEMYFPLSPLNEQHRIVAKIEELFAQLDNIASSL